MRSICTFSKTIRSFLSLGLLAMAMQAVAINYETTWFTASINPCTGFVTMDVVIYVDADDNLDDLNWEGSFNGIQMRVGSGAWINIAEMGSGHPGGGASHYTFNGDDVYYRRLSTGTISQGLSTYETGDSDSDRPAWVRSTFYLPASAIGQTVQFRFHPSAVFEEATTLPGPISVDFPSGADLGSIAATDNSNCNGVNLSWTLPNNICGGSQVQIFRNNTVTPIATVAATDLSYFDATAVAGVTYDYQGRLGHFVLANSTVFNPGGYTAVDPGTRKDVPAAPGNLQASNNNCENEIDLSWNFSSGIDNYEVYRDGILINLLGGNVASYTDDVPLRGVNYSYTVRALNNCGWGPYTSPVLGISPADPDPVGDVLATVVPGVGIALSWDDIDLETGYKIERNLLGGGGATFFNVTANTTSYLDPSIVECQTYEYRILSVNNCSQNGIPSDSTRRARLIPDLSNTFTATSLSASKGFFSNRVELSWTVANNANFIGGYKIYRKQLGSPEDSIQIASENSGTNLYIDNFADAGVLYAYTIIAETQCENLTVYSNPAQSIGFRSPFGTVTGNVTYTGGIAVQDVRISAESTSLILGNSLDLDGTGSVGVNHKPALNPTNNLILESWIRPGDLSDDFSLFAKGSSYNVDYSGVAESFTFSIGYGGGNLGSISVDASDLIANNYNHVAFQLNSDSLRYFLNGNLMASQFVSIGATIDPDPAGIVIGAGFEGMLDEVRIWHVAKDPATLKRDHSRLMTGGELGLRVYLRFNEGYGDFGYDVSRVGNIFNRNHGSFSGGISWSETIPNNSQLSVAAYTDASGNYVMNVPYNGLGESFVLTPSYLIHQFSPSTRALFIGDGSSVHNNIDFEDISSFTVTGSVFYANTNCPAEGVQLSVDGNTVVVDGLPATTDQAGQFTIQVPIGLHHVSVSKAGHGFSVGRFPETGKYNFQDDLANVQFTDSTLIKVMGRVVGGLREANKLPGFGYSTNNIGIAQLEFVSQLGGGCAGDTVLTDVNTGEFVTFLPPLKYIPSVDVVNDPTIDFGVLSLLDLSGTPVLQTVYDTTFTTTGDVVSVDSVQFHRWLPFTHRVEPVIIVKDRDGMNDFIGDTLFTHINTVTQDTVVRNLRKEPFRWPILTQKDDDYLYRCLIKVFERYVNADNSALIDSVPTTDGTLIFNNQLSHFPVTQIELADVNTPDSLKFLVYSFKPGLPNFLENISIPDYSYTRVFELNLVTGAGQSIPWEPIPVAEVPLGGDRKFRGVLLGAKTDGAQFITQGPQVPEYVLRDPPGSESSAERAVGTVKSESSSWNWNLGAAAHSQDNIYVGANFTTGIGVSTATEVENNVISGFSASISGGNSGTQSVVTTNTQSWATDSGTDLPGSGSDVYIGKSKNVQFGIAEHLSLVPDSLCTQVECFGPSMTGFRYARKYGLSIVPGGYQTTFIYPQNQIENYLIPTLKDLRSAIMQSNPKYTSVLSISDPNYAKNNDDPVFGPNVSTATPNSAEFADMSGPSYIYLAETLADSLTGDSVRFVNNQIKQWENAIRLNEWEKVNISNQAVRDSLKQNELDELEAENLEMLIAYYALVAANSIGGGTVAYGLAATPVPGASFAGYAVFAVTTTTGILQAELFEEFQTYQAAKDRIEEKYSQTEPANFSIGGGSTFNSSMTHESAASYTNSIEYTMDASLALEVTGKVNNNGIGFEKSIEMNFSSGRDWTEETTESETISFTLFDPDQGDNMSVDVYPSILGWGPIFKKQAGGQTSCPHEDEELTQYYQPGTVISETTAQVDKPTIAASPTILFNVPVDDAAVFNLTLGNESESNSGRIYTVQLVSSSNPFGAIARIDGQSSIDIAINGSTSVNKVLSIEKGPGPVYNYDSLLFVIYAPCQYSAGTSDGVDIVDSVYVSARFIPTCTDVELVAPEQAWVANTFNNDTVPAAIAGYNINFFDLENLRFEYKPSNESQWVGLETFWRDTSGFNDPSVQAIPTGQAFTLYDWSIGELTDGYYDLRVRSECTLADKTSITYSGIIDRVNPHPFGTPSPADGILSANDDLSIRFNEPVDMGALTSMNFDIRGVLNGTETGHSTSLSFDGLDDFAEITGGAALTNRSFTIQVAIKPSGSGDRAILSQGIDTGESIYLGLDASNQLVFKINDQEVNSNSAPIANDEWHYIGLSYNFDTETADMYIANESTSGVINTGNNSIFPNYTGSGRVWVGKKGYEPANWYTGKIHELRIWDRALSFSEFNVTMNRIMGGGEAGLLYNWRMDEAEGIFAIDHVRRRDATLFGPSWSVEPGGAAGEFDGSSQYLKMNTGDVVITGEMDFTLEFWFRGSGTGTGVLFSNGNADGLGSDSLYTWLIEKDAASMLHLKHRGISFQLTQNNYFDGEWHHLAVVMNRNANLSAILDGNPEAATLAGPFAELSGPAMYIGAHGYYTGTIETVDHHFAGEIDEFRFWNTARKLEQIKRDKQNRMLGNEPSLRLYLPFEDYQLDPTGIAILTPGFNEQVDAANHPVTENGTTLTANTPTIKLQRPVESISFTYSVNGDEIIFTPTSNPAMMENVTLDITVSNVKDLQGNVMASPATWIAYMDKNQVVWGDDLLVFEKPVAESLNFSTLVVNQGGASKAFSIQNIPGWLAVNPITGTVPPNSSVPVSFEVDPLVNIGDYIQDIQLLTDFGYPEKLTIDLKVRETPPNWTVDPQDFSQSMGIIGMLEIKDIISSDQEDMLAVFVGDELRGSQHVTYMPEIDRYLVFMDVYSNSNFGESLQFKIWDAGSGIVYSQVSPESITFVANGLVGSVLDPQLFSTDYEIEVDLAIDAGYNWIGVFLENADSTNLDMMLETMHASTGDQINGQASFAGFTSGNGWAGPLENSGLRPEALYKLYSSDDDTLTLRGDILDPTARPITLLEGWNWIGFISIRNQGIDQALGNLNPQEGDEIKGRSNFSVYVNQDLGWQGTLQTLVPGRGYMYKSGAETTFTYPFAGMFKSNTREPNQGHKDWQVDYAAFPTNMTVIARPGECVASARDAGLILGCFDAEGILRGLAEIQEIAGENYLFLTVAGVNGEVLSLKWIQPETSEIMDATGSLVFVSNERKGRFETPVVVALPSAFCDTEENWMSAFHLYPTAFTDHLNLVYKAGPEEQEGQVFVRDLHGRTLHSADIHLDRGYNEWRMEMPSLASGAYLISIETAAGISVAKAFRTR